MRNTEMMTGRRDFYTFLQRLFYKEIDAQLLGALKGMSFPADCGDAEMQKGYDAIASYLKSCGENSLDELAADFSKVFLGAGSHEGNAAFPYESVYLGEKPLVMQKPWEEVKKIYAQKGLALDNAPSEMMEDHIAIELQFMAQLEDTGDAKAFLEEHLLSWTDKFCADIEKYAETDFYKGAAALLRGYLHMDAALLDELEAEEHGKKAFSVTDAQLDAILAGLSKNYKVYAPKLTGKFGRNGKEIVRFGEIKSVSEIVYDRQSDFSAKEVYYPVMQTMIYFTESESRESELKDDKDILIIAHPCDINAIRRLDSIFLENGNHGDVYYARLRNKVKFVLLECTESFENCFCVSAGSNVCEDYTMALRLGDTNSVLVKDGEFASLFAGCQETEFVPKFVTENKKAVNMPKVEGKDDVKLASGLEYWNSFDEKCISCGGCNTVCPTCACFDTVDVIYDETSVDGERRRVWSSCMLDTFTLTAGGGRARKTAGANMRFKVLHKTYDFKKRFGKENMCVGCGRCSARCPKDIDFVEVVNGFVKALETAKEAK